MASSVVDGINPPCPSEASHSSKNHPIYSPVLLHRTCTVGQWLLLFLTGCLAAGWAATPAAAVYPTGQQPAWPNASPSAPTPLPAQYPGQRLTLAPASLTSAAAAAAAAPTPPVSQFAGGWSFAQQVTATTAGAPTPPIGVHGGGWGYAPQASATATQQLPAAPPAAATAAAAATPPALDAHGGWSFAQEATATTAPAPTPAVGGFGFGWNWSQPRPAPEAQGGGATPHPAAAPAVPGSTGRPGPMEAWTASVEQDIQQQGAERLQSSIAAGQQQKRPSPVPQTPATGQAAAQGPLALPPAPAVQQAAPVEAAFPVIVNPPPAPAVEATPTAPAQQTPAAMDASATQPPPGKEAI